MLQLRLQVCTGPTNAARPCLIKIETLPQVLIHVSSSTQFKALLVLNAVPAAFHSSGNGGQGYQSSHVQGANDPRE